MCGRSLGRDRQSDGSEGGRGFVGEDSGEVGAVGVDQDEFEDGGEEADADAFPSCQQEMEGEDVDEHGGEEAEAEGGGSSDEDEQASEELKGADEVHPAAGHQDSHELRGRGPGGGRRHGGQEGVQDVGAEDDE